VFRQFEFPFASGKIYQQKSHQKVVPAFVEHKQYSPP